MVTSEIVGIVKIAEDVLVFLLLDSTTTRRKQRSFAEDTGFFQFRNGIVTSSFKKRLFVVDTRGVMNTSSI